MRSIGKRAAQELFDPATDLRAETEGGLRGPLPLFPAEPENPGSGER